MKIKTLHFIIGFFALLIGTSVYFLDRSPNQIFFITKFFPFEFSHELPPVFGLLSGFLPDFAHPFAFILLTASLLSQKNKNKFMLICLVWLIIEFIFEIGQLYSDFALLMLPDWFNKIPILENCETFFLTGTFDMFDLFSIVLGSLAAYITLIMTSRKEVL